MVPTQVSLTVAFRRSGWQWPLREEDTVRVWAGGGRLVAELPGAFVLDVIRHALQAVTLQTRMREHLGPAPEAPPLLPSPISAAPSPRLMGSTGRRLRRVATTPP